MATILNTRTGKESMLHSFCAVQGTNDSIAKIGVANIVCSERTRFVAHTDSGVMIGFRAESKIPTEFVAYANGFNSSDNLVLFYNIDRLHITLEDAE